MNAITRTLFHLNAGQEALHAALLHLTDPSTFEYTLPTSSFVPFSVYTYPLVPKWPPFPFHIKPPALIQEGQRSSSDPYIRSATNLSYTRTLELLRRELGPHFELEKLWDKHTYYVKECICCKNKDLSLLDSRNLSNVMH